MQYSRAGLVALLFAFIISLVSAVPIPATESIFSSTLSPRSIPNLNGQDRIQVDTATISAEIPSGRMSTLPRALAARLTRRQQLPTDMMDDQLVRRSKIGDKIKHAFQSFGRKVKAGFQKAGKAIKSGFQKFGKIVKQGFQKAGTAIKKGFQKVKQGFQKAGTVIKQGFQKAGKAIKHGFQVAGHAIGTAAKKVWHFVKTTGAKIAKFGLKVIQSVEKVASKVVSFIPVIGKPLSKAMDGISKVAGVISDRIKVKLPAKLQKGMDVMNKANKILSFIPRRRELSEEEGFQQRDIDEAYHFEERDDIALENQKSYSEVNERDIYDRYGLYQK